MEYTNGAAAAGAQTPATAMTKAVTQSPLTDSNEHTKAIARFMPAMSIGDAVRRRETIVEATRLLMHDGVDFGKIPGSEKPTLLQPGADKLCNLFGLVIRYRIDVEAEDWSGAQHDGEPFFYYRVIGQAFRGDDLMGEGMGSCSSWESKYRWRKGERKCPSCHASAIIKGKAEYGGGWLCFARKGGCGAKFPDGAAVIEEQQVGRMENPDPHDAVNTVLKMALKRCKISTTINATSASEFFTQDVEDMQPLDAPIDTGGHRHGTREAAQFVAEQKIAAQSAATPKPWNNRGEARNVFQRLRERVGETAFLSELGRLGCRSIEDLLRSTDKAGMAYNTLSEIARKEVA